MVRLSAVDVEVKKGENYIWADAGPHMRNFSLFSSSHSPSPRHSFLASQLNLALTTEWGNMGSIDPVAAANEQKQL